MKMLLGLIAVLAMGTAQAANYDLHPAACGFNTYGSCIVYKDTATQLNLSWNVNGALSLSTWAVDANGGVTLTDTYTGQNGGNPLQGISNAVLTDSLGNAAQVSGTFATRRTCVGSGRGQHCTVYVTFLGGTVTE